MTKKTLSSSTRMGEYRDAYHPGSVVALTRNYPVKDLRTMAVPWIAVPVVLLFTLLSTGATHAADIVNAGFEDGRTGADRLGLVTAISDVAHSGFRTTMCK